MKSLALVLTLGAVSAFAQQRTGMHYLITETTVANLLRANGTNVNSSQVHLPMQLMAADAEPHLEIMAAHRLTEHELGLEVHCQDTSECLPFDVVIDADDADTISLTGQRAASLSRWARQSSVNEITQRSSLPAESTASTSNDLRVGARAVLVIVDGRMRIHLPVIALDTGAKGTMIRVSTLDRKKIFHAVVLDGSTVQGAIE